MIQFFNSVIVFFFCMGKNFDCSNFGTLIKGLWMPMISLSKFSHRYFRGFQLDLTLFQFNSMWQAHQSTLFEWENEAVLNRLKFSIVFRKSINQFDCNRCHITISIGMRCVNWLLLFSKPTEKLFTFKFVHLIWRHELIPIILI